MNEEDKEELLDLVKHWRERAEKAEAECDRLEGQNDGLRLTLETVYETATKEGIPAGQRLFEIEEELRGHT